MDIETLNKTLLTISKVEKAICIPMILGCSAIAIVDFFNNDYFCGAALVICTIYWANIVRIYFLMKKKSGVNKVSKI